MGEWIRKQLDLVPLKGDLTELGNRLIPAEALLANRRATGYHPLAISVVGFLRRKPFVMMVSNYTDLDGAIREPCPTLTLYGARPRKPEARFLGMSDAVPPEDRDRLRSLLARRATHEDVRSCLAATTARAAKQTATISKECVTGYLLPSGERAIGPHGIPEGIRYMPAFVVSSLRMGGITGFNTKSAENGTPLLPRWVGSTAQTSLTPHGVVTVMLNVVRNVADPITVEPKQGVHGFWKMAGPNEPDAYNLSTKSKYPETLTTEYSARLAKRNAYDAASAFAEASSNGFDARDLVVIVTELADPRARALVERSEPGAITPSTAVVTLVEVRNDAVRLLSFDPNASAAVACAPPADETTVVCVAAGGVRVGYAVFVDGKMRVREWLR